MTDQPFGRAQERRGAGSAWHFPARDIRLGAWIARQPKPKPSRSEAIRRLIEKGMVD